MRPLNLIDFIRKSAASKAARKVDDNVYRIPATSPDTKRECTPYRLPEAQAKQLAGFANPDCWQCKGSGIKGWRNSGLVADVCKCVKANLAERESALARAQDALYKKVEEEAKAEIKAAPSVARPSRACTECPETGVCPKCAGSKIHNFSDEEWLASKMAKKMRAANEKGEPEAK